MTIAYSGDSITFPDNSVQNTAATGFGFKNRILNGSMVIDQRNAGASVTPTADGTFSVDRWQARLSVPSKYSIQQNAAAVALPSGFSKYLGVTSLSAYTVGASEFFAVQQTIEGFNIADLSWGTANAQTVTISFVVRSSLTGTFGGAIYNSAGNRCYPFSYSVSAANTWETKYVTIAGDTSGTWLTDNGVGVTMLFGLGAGATVSGTAGAWGSTLYRSATGATSVVGTSGATFSITGVQLEKGSTATSFDYRPYGTELALCQRYREQGTLWQAGYGAAGAAFSVSSMFAVVKRATPTITTADVNNANTNAGVSTSNITTASIELETTIVVTSGARFARSFAADAEL